MGSLLFISKIYQNKQAASSREPEKGLDQGLSVIFPSRNLREHWREPNRDFQGL